MNTYKRNIVSPTINNETTYFTEKTCLKPIATKHKYDNVNLFNYREIEMRNKEEELKQNLVKLKQKSTTQLKPLNSSLYLTDANIICEPHLVSIIEDDKRSNSNNIAHILSTGPNTTTNKNANLLVKIAEKKHFLQEEKEKQFIFPMLDKKGNSIQAGKKDCVRDYMNKTREIILMKYSSKVKKESAIRLKETYDNELEMAKETINSMEEARKLFDDTFLNKFNEYVKFLLFQREQEKNTDNLLVDEINKLQNDFQTIDIRKRKQESDKMLYEKWLYLQIQIKEKKLELPSYYKILIEQGDISTQKQPKRNSALNVIGQIKKQTVRATSISMLSNLSTEDKERVLNYRNQLVFDSPNDLFEEFNKLEKANLEKINLYNGNREHLRELTKEKDDIVKRELKDSEAIDIEITSKEKILLNVRKKHNQLMKDRMKLINRQGVSKEKRKQSLSFDLNPLNCITNNSSISNIVLKRIVDLHFNLMDYISGNKEMGNSIQMNINNLSKKDNNEMVDMIKYIELAFNKLISSYHEYLQGNRSFELKEIKNQIEKVHKKRKALQQKENQLLRLEKLKNRIQGREGKIYFLPQRKLETNYGRFMKKDRKVLGQGQKCNQLTFEDFMYDMINDTNRNNDN